MIVVSAFEAPTVVTGLDDVAMVSQAVEQRGGHLGIAEHARPFTEREIGVAMIKAYLALSNEGKVEPAERGWCLRLSGPTA